MESRRPSKTVQPHIKLKLNLQTVLHKRSSNHTTDPSDTSNLSSVLLMPNIEATKSQMPEKMNRLQIDFKGGEP
jgi:hypothetical protein